MRLNCKLYSARRSSAEEAAQEARGGSSAARSRRFVFLLRCCLKSSASARQSARIRSRTLPLPRRPPAAYASPLGLPPPLARKTYRVQLEPASRQLVSATRVRTGDAASSPRALQPHTQRCQPNHTCTAAPCVARQRAPRRLPHARASSAAGTVFFAGGRKARHTREDGSCYAGSTGK
jgi:hypothetical protein